MYRKELEYYREAPSFTYIVYLRNEDGSNSTPNKYHQVQENESILEIMMEDGLTEKQCKEAIIYKAELETIAWETIEHCFHDKAEFF